jgi:hypothetical protein
VAICGFTGCPGLRPRKPPAEKSTCSDRLVSVPVSVRLKFRAAINDSTATATFVTGVMSSVEDRYQSRVIWLVPMLAGAFVLAWLSPNAQN